MIFMNIFVFSLFCGGSVFQSSLLNVDGWGATLLFTCGSQIGPLSLIPRVLIMNLCVTTFKQAGLDSLS